MYLLVELVGNYPPLPLITQFSRTNSTLLFLDVSMRPYSGHHWRRSGEVMAGMDRPNDAGQDEPRFEPQVSCILSSPNSQIPNLPACASAPTPVSRVGLPNPNSCQWPVYRPAPAMPRPARAPQCWLQVAMA